MRLLLLLIPVLLLAQPSAKYGDLISQAVCDEGVNYSILINNGIVTQAEAEFQAVTEDQFNGWDDNTQIAWLSNLYNFYTIQLIIDNYPLESITHIENSWDISFIPLWGDQISLNQIEHELIRQQYDEPRIHFALVCASIGCPSLRGEPFQGATLISQLDEQAENFLTDESKNRIEGDKLYISQIFQWYGDDFNSQYGNYQNYIKSVLEIHTRVRFYFNEYDWNLNQADCN